LTIAHEERKHSKFSASGAERWFNCPGSVELSEGLPERPSPWSIEGTRAHELLEGYLNSLITGQTFFEGGLKGVTPEMRLLGHKAALFIYRLHLKLKGSEIKVETRMGLPFIHKDMFGTFDAAVIDHFATLHVFDYKYGAGVPVSPIDNLQMITYGMAAAHLFKWNFSKVRLWIIQPRIKGYDGPVFWEISIEKLKSYVLQFRKAVKRVEQHPNLYKEGSYCHWCKAQSVCPLKQKGKLEAAQLAFASFERK
jgi:hypothetical protein